MGKRLIVGILLVLPLAQTSFAKNVIIDTPSVCVNAVKVDGDKVYLSTLSQNCAKGTGKAEIKLDSETQTVRIFVDGQLWKTQEISSSPNGLVTAAEKRAHDMSQKMKVPKNLHQDKVTSRVKEAADYVNSDEFQNKVTAEQNRIRQQLFPGNGQIIKNYYTDLPKGDAATRQGRLSKNERIYIFISLSIPLETLRNYAISVDVLNDPNIVMVMRGMVNSMSNIADTGNFILKIVNKDESCDPSVTKCPTYIAPVQIDPLLFGRYQINQVPAIVYVKDVNVKDEGSEGLEENLDTGDSYTVFGDVSLEYALNYIRREAGNSSLEKVIARFRSN